MMFRMMFFLVMVIMMLMIVVVIMLVVFLMLLRHGESRGLDELIIVSSFGVSIRVRSPASFSRKSKTGSSCRSMKLNKRRVHWLIRQKQRGDIEGPGYDHETLAPKGGTDLETLSGYWAGASCRSKNGSSDEAL